MKTLRKIKQLFVVIVCFLFISCEDFLEVEEPTQKMVSETVFSNDETALSVMTGIYNQLFDVPYSSGGSNSVTVLAGLSADDLTTIRATNFTFMEFDQHEIQPNNSANYNLWASAFNIIYLTNSLLEGIENSEKISEEVRNRLEGEAKFVRAFTYFYLTNLYGDVPLILSTDYRINSLKTRDSQEKIYQQILLDLQRSKEILGASYVQGDRTMVTRYTATALLSRVNLYLQNWDIAESLSTEMIEGNGQFKLLENLDSVFLANSEEAIWQLSPVGRGNNLTNTNEGSTFLIHPFLTSLSHIKLSETFIDSFEDEDKRIENWVGFHLRTGSYFPFKYKIRNSTEAITEYSMVLRLAEQYLIRAEARTMQNDLSGAVADVDKIRIRAGLLPVSNTDSLLTSESLLDIILVERKRELFSEWGHRWLDLKRTGNATDFIGEGNQNWQETDVLYPIPEQERLKNPNLSQNNGY